MKTETIEIAAATRRERTWAANLLARSEPWTTLGVTRRQCRLACHDPEYLLFIARAVNVRRPGRGERGPTAAAGSGRPLGVLILHPRGVAGSPYVKSIAVDGRYRGRGTGAALMAFAEDRFRDRARHMFLCVSSFNTRARTFYRRLGYRQVGRFRDYVIPGADELLMHKRLR